MKANEILKNHARRCLSRRERPAPRNRSRSWRTSVPLNCSSGWRHAESARLTSKKIHHGTVPPPRIFGHETAGNSIVRSSARAFCGFSVGRARCPPSPCSLHEMPCLPTSCFCAMPTIQASYWHHCGVRTSRRRLCRIRPCHVFRPAWRCQNSPAKTLSWKVP